MVEFKKIVKRPGRYRKVEVRTWGDEKFRSLSCIPACGQGLWLYLITGPHTGPIPGLFRAGRASMSEELDWSLEDFGKAFDEVLMQGMVEADFKARVMWIPNALIHNRPESPNVVRSWGGEFDLIPECSLKVRAWEALKEQVSSMGESFKEAFDESMRKPLLKASRKSFGKTIDNQEQEQEQEQEQKSTPTPPPAARAKRKTSLPTGFSISDRVTAWASAKGYGDLPAHFESFVSKATAKDYRYVDWDEALMGAIRDDWAKLRVTGAKQRVAQPDPDQTDYTVGAFNA